MTYRAVMSDERAAPAEDAAAHLDEDAEALEDPVHSGDARHQHELHEHEQAQGRQPDPGSDAR